MHLFHARSCFTTSMIVFLVCILVSAAAAADIEMEGVLGETITLHGASYTGDSVYLFLTGPGLPENGVTLTNTDLRADKGQFTVVALDDNQEWSYTWKTSRIANEIDPGTYIVYVTNQPADKAHLGGTSSYKTLSIFLKDSGASKVSIDAGKAYTLNPEEHVSTPRPAPSVNITNVTTPATTVLVTTPTLPISAVPSLPPATRSGNVPLAAAIAILGGICLLSRKKGRR
jgi:hypothetical protein